MYPLKIKENSFLPQICAVDLGHNHMNLAKLISKICKWRYTLMGTEWTESNRYNLINLNLNINLNLWQVAGFEFPLYERVLHPSVTNPFLSCYSHFWWLVRCNLFRGLFQGNIVWPSHPWAGQAAEVPVDEGGEMLHFLLHGEGHQSKDDRWVQGEFVSACRLWSMGSCSTGQ